jgi:hypothetical protein
MRRSNKEICPSQAPPPRHDVLSGTARDELGPHAHVLTSWTVRLGLLSFHHLDAQSTKYPHYLLVQVKYILKGSSAKVGPRWFQSVTVFGPTKRNRCCGSVPIANSLARIVEPSV